MRSNVRILALMVNVKEILDELKQSKNGRGKYIHITSFEN